jgi:uncharacterized protein (DUF305 family)
MGVRPWVAPALLVAVLGLGACGPRGSDAGAPPPPPDAVSPDRDELEDLFWARQEEARARFTEADVRFMTGMIGHHAQAIVMAGLVPERTGSRAIRILAARIINAQEDEIAIMERWLRDRGQPVPEIHVHGTTLMIHGAEHHPERHHDMPGMLTPEQLDHLAEAQGVEFERLFLTGMIEHHRGAVTMVRELFATDGAAQDPEVFRFASDVQVDQATEIARMERMLAELAAGGQIRP